MTSVDKRNKTMAVNGGDDLVGRNGKRRRRLGICHHSETLMPAPLRLLQDLAKPAALSPSLHRRNAFRKNSTPAKPCAPIEIAAGQAGQTCQPVHQQRCSLTAVSPSVSVISTRAVVVVYVADRRLSTTQRRRTECNGHKREVTEFRRRLSYPVARRGVRRTRRPSVAPTTSWIQPSGVTNKQIHPNIEMPAQI